MNVRRANSILVQSRPFMGRSITMPVAHADSPITNQQARNFLIDLLSNATREQQSVARISIDDVLVDGIASLILEVNRLHIDLPSNKTRRIRVTVEVLD